MWCGISPPAVLSCFILFGNISEETVTLPRGSSLLLLFSVETQNRALHMLNPHPSSARLQPSLDSALGWSRYLSGVMLVIDTRQYKEAGLIAEAAACPFWWPRDLHLCVFQSFTLSTCRRRAFSPTVVRSRRYICLSVAHEPILLMWAGFKAFPQP